MKKKGVAVALALVVGIIAIVVLWNCRRISGKIPDRRFTQEVVELFRSKYGVTDGHVVLVDFSRPSCEDRLFVLDLSKGTYVLSGAVLHGMGGKSTPRVPEFSNEPGSRCSSLGVYEVAELSRTFVCYPCLRLDGLSPTNSNARVRGILVHPSIMVSLRPFELEGRCFPLTKSSEGCFSVSLYTFSKIKSLRRPVYIYAYDGRAGRKDRRTARP